MSAVVAAWQPKINVALTDLKRIAKALFFSAISLGKSLAAAKEAFGREVDWLADLNVAITAEDEKFYMTFAQGCLSSEKRLTPEVDIMPRKVMELIDVAYHTAVQASPADEDGVKDSSPQPDDEDEEDYFSLNA